MLVITLEQSQLAFPNAAPITLSCWLLSAPPLAPSRRTTAEKRIGPPRTARESANTRSLPPQDKQCTPPWHIQLDPDRSVDICCASLDHSEHGSPHLREVCELTTNIHRGIAAAAAAASLLRHTSQKQTIHTEHNTTQPKHTALPLSSKTDWENLYLKYATNATKAHWSFYFCVFVSTIFCTESSCN